MTAIEERLFANVGCNIVAPEVDSIPAYSKEVYLKQVVKYKRCGFSHLEFSHVKSISTDDAAEIRWRCKELGIAPWSIHSEHLNEGDDVEGYFKIQTHCFQVADALDARTIVCHLPHLSPRFDFERAMNVIGRLAGLTRKYGLRLAIENADAKGDVDFIIKVIDALKLVDVGFNLDTGHAVLYETRNVAAIAKKIGKRLFTTHLQDNFGENDDHQAPGMGVIDWPSTLSAIAQTGYQGPFMLEMTGNSGKARRTVPQLREFDLDKELAYARAYIESAWASMQ